MKTATTMACVDVRIVEEGVRLRNQPFDIALEQMQRLRALAEKAQNVGQPIQGTEIKAST